MKLDIFNNTSPNATAKDAVGVRYHDRGTGTTCYGSTSAEAIDNLCKYVDRDQVNALLQKDDRFSTDINRAIARAGASLLLLVATFGFVFVMTEPDEQVTGWMSNDAPVMEAK